MIQKEQKYFADIQTGRLNSDDATFALQNNEWVNAENIRTGTTDAGATAIVESIGSTRLINSPQPSINFIEIGSVEDTENARFCTFYFNTTGTNHKIECTYVDTETIYTVLRSNDVIGGLNFSKYFPIHSAVIVNGLLTWVESTNNEPKQINIDAAIKLYHPTFPTNQVPFVSPIDPDEIKLIKIPPTFYPLWAKNTDGAFQNNFIANNSFSFAFQYVWFDNQTTVTGVYSTSTKLNAVGETLNVINISRFGDPVPQRVRLVNLVVRYDSEFDGKPTNVAKVIKTWDRLIPSENALINSGALTFDFYNNIDGIPLAPDDVLRPFDNVPIYSETIAAAKNRLFLANNTEGYDTPKTTSLSTQLISTQVQGASNFIIAPMVIRQGRLRSGSSLNWGYAGVYVQLSASQANPAGFYVYNGSENFITAPPGTILTGQADPLLYPPYTPSTILLSNLTFRAADYAGVLNWVASNPAAGFPTTNGGYDSITWLTPNTVSIAGLTLSTFNVFKPRSLRNLGVVFYDSAMRKCGVATNETLQISIPNRDYAFTTGVGQVLWSLSNANAINEIPEFAAYYAIVSTLNQETRFFVDNFTNAAKYAQKTNANTYVFNSTVFVNGAIGIGLNTSALNDSGLGYVYTEGDICVLTRDDNTTYTLPIIGQDGNYIIVSSKDIGSLSGRSFVYQIYTPYKPSVEEPYYEIGQIYKVLNPHSSLRQYSLLNNSILPDTYAMQRAFGSGVYFASAMSPNDAFYKRWDTDAGKVNYVTKLGQVKKINFISFSDTFVPNTSINGLSTFRALNQTNVPEDCGAITKLQLTSKIQGEGTVMLSICRNETNSMYLGEQQITDSTGATQFFAKSSGVIGTINTLKGNFGCIDATTVVQYRGNVYFLDRLNGRVIQYSINGLDVISDYKMNRFWKLWCAKFNSMTTAEIEAFGDRPFIFSAVDSAHDEILYSLPKLSNDPPKGYLPDYPSTVYPFDILDYRGKTVVYKIGSSALIPHWQGSYSFVAEGFLSIQNKLFSFKYGNMWLHNQLTSQNNFYGVQYTSKIMFTSNGIPQIPKVYQNISSESNIVPKFLYFYNEYPIQQSSDLVDYEFRDIEGVWYATLKRNKIVPTATGFTTDGLLTGEVMRNTNMLILAEFEPIAEPLELRFITVGFIISKGHRLTTK